MAFVVGILQPGDHGLGRAHAAGKLGLGEAGVLAELKNLVGDFTVGDFSLKPSKFTLVAGASREYIQRVTDALPPAPPPWYSTQDPWGLREAEQPRVPMNSPTPLPANPVSHQLEDGMGIKVDDFEQSGLYLLFPGGRRIVLTRDKIEAFAQAFESNLDQIPVEIRRAVGFQACPVCPEKDRAKFCHALPATLAFFEELKGFKSFDNVSAVYKGREPSLVVVPKTTIQEALQFVVIFSLMYYCEVGKQYWKYFLGIHPLMSPRDMVTRIHLNVHWDCKGDKQKVDKVLRSFGDEITCTCRCQVERLRLICKNDGLMNAFVNTQAQIEWLAMTKDALLEQSFEEFLKNG